MVDLVSNPDQAKPKTINTGIFAVSLLDVQHRKKQCEALIVCGIHHSCKSGRAFRAGFGLKIGKMPGLIQAVLDLYFRFKNVFKA